MKYMLLIASSDESWDVLSAEQRAELGAGHQALTRELTESGVLVSSEGLADERTSTTVRVRDGVVETTDGPYAETKEHLAGYYLVQCASRDEAVAIAARVPDATYTAVEVRPVLDVAGMDF